MTNDTVLLGKVLTDPEYNHEICGQRFLKTVIEVTRSSGNVDHINVMFPDYMKGFEVGNTVYVEGHTRTYKDQSVVLYVLAKSVEVLDSGDGLNECVLEGYIANHPTFRITKSGRTISDVKLAVNRKYNKTDYIPLIFWNEYAFMVSNMHQGDYLYLKGRIQSRKYTKDNKEKEVYEVSATNLLDVACG